MQRVMRSDPDLLFIHLLLLHLIYEMRTPEDLTVFEGTYRELLCPVQGNFLFENRESFLANGISFPELSIS